MDQEWLTVVGAGTMGTGIAQVCLAAGFSVVLIEADAQRRAQVGELLSEQVADQRLLLSDTLTAIAGSFVIEAIPEDRAQKQALFRELGGACDPSVVLASNTSSIPVEQLAAGVPAPERILGLHFFNPVPVMRLVEVVRAAAASDATVARGVALAERLGKVPVVVRDAPGFVANRLLMPLINEAVYALMDGVAPAEAIDTVARLGLNHPMGPLRLADLIGLDVCLAILEVLHQELGEPRFQPCPLLVAMVHEGKLGRKTGHGFFKYEFAARKGY